MTRRGRAACGAALLLSFASCQVVHDDPFAAGEADLQGGRLPRALARLDSVPTTHPRYADARALALAVERRLRTSQEMITRGLGMRSQHDDAAAIRHFEQALEIWPEEQRAHDLIAATRSRQSAFGSGSSDAGGDVVTTSPVDETAAGAGPAPAPGVETALPFVVPEAPVAMPTEPRSVTPVEPNVAAPTLRIPKDRIAKAEQHLVRGDLERALDLLEEGPPNVADAEVERALVRVLRQRALLRYGQGLLEEAIADWQRILAILPDDAQSTGFVKAARTELADRRRGG